MKSSDENKLLYQLLSREPVEDKGVVRPPFITGFAGGYSPIFDPINRRIMGLSDFNFSGFFKAKP